MPKLLFVVFVFLIYTRVDAQDGNWLSSDARYAMAKIFSSQTAAPKGEELETKYLSAYSSFFTYMSFERKPDATHFIEQYEAFEELNEEASSYQLMLINLSIQKSLLLFMQGQMLEGAHVFYKAHRIFIQLDKGSFGLEYLKLQAIFDIFLDQVPQQHKAFTSFFGLKGNAKRGFTTLDQYLKEVYGQQGVYQEAIILYGYCLLKFAQPSHDEIYDYISLTGRQNAPILVFISSALALKHRMGEEAMTISSSWIDEYNKKFPLIFYIKGRALLNAMDERALDAFSKFHQYYKGNSFKTDALMREAWWYHITGAFEQRNDNMKQVDMQTVLPTSNDKQAKAEILNLREEPAELLKARLLFDGGYYGEAKKVLEHMDKLVLTDYILAEYYYRYARVNQELNAYNKALFFYEKVIGLCVDDERYIGPYSALESAHICVKLHRSAQALAFLEKAKDLNTGQYKNDIRRKVAQFEKKLGQ